MDLSHVTRPTVSVILQEHSSLDHNNFFYPHYYTGTDRTPFPPGSRGFFYYDTHMSNTPAEAGEVRFRVTSGNDPTSFSPGVDLLWPNGTPWRIPLLLIARGASTGKAGGRMYEPLRQILMKHGLVTPALLKKCDTMNEVGHGARPSSRIIYSLGHLFSVNFHQHGLRFLCPHDGTGQRIYLQHMFSDRSKPKTIIPYHGKRRLLFTRGFVTYPLAPTGSALCCFERSSLPAHRESRTIVMRIVRMTSPVRFSIPGYKGYRPIPKEGELVMTRIDVPWSLDVDKSIHTALQGLFRDQ
jgi:hypothetical protein